MNKQKLIASFWKKFTLLKKEINLFKRDIQIILSERKLPKVQKEIQVAVTYRCSLGCNYCYAKHLKKLIKHDMRLEDFQRIVDWVKPQNIMITFIGGEPTEHPYIPEMIDLCKQNHVDFRLATNNLFDKSLFQKIKGNKFVLKNIVNYNTKRFYTKEKYQIFQRNLKIMHNVGIDFYLYFNITKLDTFSDYKLLIKDAKKYNTLVGISLTAPHNIEQDDEAKKLIYIVKNAKKANVICFLTRPILKCMFSESQWKKLKQLLTKYYNYSICDFGPPVINPDLTVFPCNSLNSLSMKGPSIFYFKDLKAIYDYYQDKVEKIAWKPLDKKCIDCLYRVNHRCQGGCLLNKI